MKKICIKAVNVFILMLVLLTFGMGSKVVPASDINSGNNSVVKIMIEEDNGNIKYQTGICVGKFTEGSDRFILTTKTNLEKNVKRVTTKFNGLEDIELTIKKISDKANMAVLSIASGSNGEFNPVKVGDAGSLKVGETVRIIGFSNGDEKAQTKQTVISSVDIRSDFKSFAVAGTVDEVSHGSAVFDSKDNLVGMIVDPDPSVSDRTDIVYINYISSVLSDSSYEKYEDKTSMFIIIGIAAAVVIAVIIALVLVHGKKNKGKKIEKEVAPDDHSDGRTVAIVPPSSRGESSNQPGIAIVGVTGYFAGKRFPVPKHVIIGRDPKRVQIVFPDKTMGVSALHCELRNNSGALMLVDLGSTYGTFLQNGEKLQPSNPHLISPGEEFYLGTKDNRFKVTM